MAGRLVWLREHVWEIRFRRYIALAVALALVAAGVWAGMTVADQRRSCAAGVSRPEGGDECVGVATGRYDFGQRELTEVVDAIHKENRALKKGSYVTVAILEPFTARNPDTMGDVLHELQGAYLAQRQANDGPYTPRIRLVLANTGATGEHWERTVDQLAGMTGAPHHLRAVTGIGSSTDPNKAAVKELTARGIPVIGTSITADDLANGQDGAENQEPYPGLARVAPTNKDLARALTSYAKISADRAYLVHDKTGDPYTRTLQASFERLVKGSRYAPATFTPPADRTEEGLTANTFRQISLTLCGTRPTTNTILFAGRHTQLRQFVNALGEHCGDRKFTLLTGDDASYLTGDTKLDAAALDNLTVRYTALAHPDAWTGEDPPGRGGTPSVAQRLNETVAEERALFDEDALDDGQLTVAYDAMTLAAHGIREATPEGRKIPPLEQVRNEWPHINGPRLRVNGASGWICLDNHGNPYDKAVPIVELTEEREARFLEIAWPEGRPPEQECVPPPDAS